MSASDEIVRLSALWYRLVGIDHHKDRDCHWYIEAKYSYGQEPVFSAYHHGYVHHEWTGPNRATWTEAEADLLAELQSAINEQREWAERQVADEGEWSYDEARATLAILDGPGGA